MKGEIPRQCSHGGKFNTRDLFDAIMSMKHLADIAQLPRFGFCSDSWRSNSSAALKDKRAVMKEKRQRSIAGNVR